MRINARPADHDQIDIQPMGWEATGYMARGHWRADDFHRAVRAYDGQWTPPQGIQHAWWRCVPNSDHDEGGYFYHPARPGSRGAFAVTFTHHAGPSCIWCPACKGKAERRWAPREAVRNRKALLALWREAEAGNLVRVEIEPQADGGFAYVRYPYRDIDEQRRREAA
jgi:hypothetical protein